jgi:DNA-binding MarR family transcriptional regulator
VKPEAAGDDGVVDLFAMVHLTGLLRQAFSDRMRSEKWAAQAGFRPPCAGMLIVIGRLQPVSQRDVGRLMRIDPADVVGVVDILEHAGLVERNRDPADRRRYALSLTKAGVGRAARLDALRRAAVDEVLGALTTEEQHTLAQLVTKAVGPLPRGAR